jgi:hypothetical protein
MFPRKQFIRKARQGVEIVTRIGLLSIQQFAACIGRRYCGKTIFPSPVGAPTLSSHHTRDTKVEDANLP